MKKFIALILLTAFNAHAEFEVGLHFDTQGNLIHPDAYILAKAIKADEKGFSDTATKKYAQSAKFGNKNAMYLNAMHYFKSKDWANGYAWVRLIKGNFLDVKSFKAQILPLMTDAELQSSNLIFQSLEEDYSDIAALERREKWEKSIKLTGSHLGGIDRSTSNVRIYFGDTGQSITQNNLSKQVLKFKYEYEEVKTDIKMGEIITVDK